MMSFRHTHKALMLGVLAICVGTAQAEICVQNSTQYKARIIQAQAFTPMADGSLDIQNQVDKRTLMPQEEYCIPAGHPTYRDSTRFAFQLIANLDDIPRRSKAAHFNVLENPLPPINSTITLTGTLAAPRAKVLTNLRPFNYGRLKRVVVSN
jgi:hypothetical protein